MLKVPAERPVEPLTIALLRDVKDACAQLGTQFVLAGATARDVLMWHLHDIKAQRLLDKLGRCDVSRYSCRALSTEKVKRLATHDASESFWIARASRGHAPYQLIGAARDSSAHHGLVHYENSKTTNSTPYEQLRWVRKIQSRGQVRMRFGKASKCQRSELTGRFVIQWRFPRFRNIEEHCPIQG